MGCRSIAVRSSRKPADFQRVAWEVIQVLQYRRRVRDHTAWFPTATMLCSLVAAYQSQTSVEMTHILEALNFRHYTQKRRNNRTKA